MRDLHIGIRRKRFCTYIHNENYVLCLSEVMPVELRGRYGLTSGVVAVRNSAMMTWRCLLPTRRLVPVQVLGMNAEW